MNALKITVSLNIATFTRFCGEELDKERLTCTDKSMMRPGRRRAPLGAGAGCEACSSAAETISNFLIPVYKCVTSVKVPTDTETCTTAVSHLTT